MLTGINEVNISTLISLYKFTLASKGNLMVFGPAGVGKTETAIQTVKNMGYDPVYMNLSVMESPDLVGLPMVDKDTKTTEYASPKFLPLEGTLSKKAVLVVDEIDKAKQELQNPMLELFQFRSVNGRKLDICSIIATGNLPDEGAFSLPVSHALTNRCLVYRLVEEFEPWRVHALDTGINPLIVGFLAKNPSYLLKPRAAEDETAYCHPSPRAWSMASRDLKEYGNDNDIEFQSLLVAGRVGSEAAISFQVWLEHYKTIDPLIDRLLAGQRPDTSKLSLDQLLVLSISACQQIAETARKEPFSRGTKKEQEAFTRTIKSVMSWMADDVDPDLCIAGAKATMKLEFLMDKNINEIPEFKRFFNKIVKAYEKKK